MHDKNLIYRDIKLDDFPVGRPDNKNANSAWPVNYAVLVDPC